MWPQSFAFTDAVKRSHSMVSKVDVYARYTPTDQPLYTLVVEDGNVDDDETADVSGKCEVRLTDVDGSLTPADATDLLSPYGNELFLQRGIHLADGTNELIPLGVFGISQTQVEDSGGNLFIRSAGFDRSRKVRRARFAGTYNILRGTNVVTAITTMIQAQVPTLQSSEIAAVPTTYVTASRQAFEQGSDPWEKAQKMAESIGYRIWFDFIGRLRLEPIPNFATRQPVATYVEGAECVLLGLNRVLDDENNRNGVIVTGEGSGVGTPVRYERWDDNPASPTYYLGNYGKVPDFFSSPLIGTTAQAQAVAEARFYTRQTEVEGLSFPLVANPAHEIGDVVFVKRDRSKVDGYYVVSNTNKSLSPGGPLNMTSRKRNF